MALNTCVVYGSARGSRQGIKAARFMMRQLESRGHDATLIDSEEMVGDITSRLRERLPELTWRVRVNEQDRLEWHGRIHGKKVIETREPLTSTWLRLKAWFLRIAPESQL